MFTPSVAVTSSGSIKVPFVGPMEVGVIVKGRGTTWDGVGAKWLFVVPDFPGVWSGKVGAT